MELEKFHTVYFIGIGGIGMSALARYFNHHGQTVLGYDRSKTALTDQLEKEGIKLHTHEDLECAQSFLKEKEKTLIVYTPAIPNTHLELNFFLEEKFTVKKRSEVLGAITKSSNCIAIAGTHGKTTTTSIIAHILNHSGKGCNAFIGGIASNYNSNIILGKKGDLVVVEADEFDRSFLTLSPNYSVITSMDADHLDIYEEAENLKETFKEFALRLKPGGTLFIEKSISSEFRIDEKSYSYSNDQPADFIAKNIKVENGSYVFDFEHPDGIIRNIKFQLPGRHNILNATVGAATALQLGIQPEKIQRSLESYLGVKRRFEYIARTENTHFIDDYAHHPEELKATISSVRELYPRKKITGIFQPHLYTRTRDFADEFAESLELLDEIIMLPIYPAREKPITGVDSQLILNKINKGSKKILEKNELLYWLRKNQPEVLITLGAGDIDQLVQPIKEIICN